MNHRKPEWNEGWWKIGSGCPLLVRVWVCLPVIRRNFILSKSHMTFKASVLAVIYTAAGVGNTVNPASVECPFRENYLFWISPSMNVNICDKSFRTEGASRYRTETSTSLPPAALFSSSWGAPRHFQAGGFNPSSESLFPFTGSPP